MFDTNLLHKAAAILEDYRSQHITLATAESCTGGRLTALLTDIAGSSDVVDRGFVTYSNAAKEDHLHVPANIIASHGSVSQPVAAAMAQGVVTYSRADIGVSITGIAGPSGGTAEKPIGLVFVGTFVRGEPTPTVTQHLFTGTRHIIRIEAVNAALDALADALLRYKQL